MFAKACIGKACMSKEVHQSAKHGSVRVIGTTGFGVVVYFLCITNSL